MRHLTYVHRGAVEPETVVVELDGDRVVITRGGRAEEAHARFLPDGRLSLVFESGRQLCGRVLARPGGEVEVSSGSGVRRFALAEPLLDRLAHRARDESGKPRDEEVRALMPGRVVEVAVAPGDVVPVAGLLLVLEAMKMQNEIRATRGGRVLRVEVENGRPVEGGALLMVLQAADGD
jgi:biotin carboxyl carrier protein